MAGRSNGAAGVFPSSGRSGVEMQRAEKEPCDALTAMRVDVLLALAALLTACAADPDDPPPVSPIAPAAAPTAPAAPDPLPSSEAAPTPEPPAAAPLAEAVPEAEAVAGASPDELERARVRQGSIETDGPLSGSTVRRVVGRHRSEVLQCYRRALEVDRGVTGRVEVRVEIGSSGAVAQATAPSDVVGPAMADCLTDAVRRWTFPGAETSTQVTLPFVLSVG